MSAQYNYRFYATLLDTFQGYLSCEEIWSQYWGNSENPSKSLEQFKQEQFQSIFDRINRVPIPWEDKEAADRGTAFNEIIDCMILGVKSDKMEIERVCDTTDVVAIKAKYNDREFVFPISVCREFAHYYKGAIPQVWTEAILTTSKGDVLLCGYIDELMPSVVHDIKTTGKYSVGKYRNNWQHRVYPFCLQANGSEISEFEYNVAQIEKYGKIETFTEQYFYRAERDIADLQSFCEEFIIFLEAHRHLITDTKIFGL